ncbi:MAG TPA: 6-carboxytetrahydropterin synthase [Saprospiraceae bacterium]|nr:6-carboxytetrahydropterin synthase [Saprospiraceae bacterium]
MQQPQLSRSQLRIGSACSRRGGPQTGYLIDLGLLRDIIYEEVELRFDHKNLNLDTEEFKNLIPSAEHICFVIWNLLRRRLDERYDLQVRLYETPRNFVEYPA